MADFFFSLCIGCGGSRGVIFWYNLIFSLMNLTSGVVVFICFSFYFIW